MRSRSLLFSFNYAIEGIVYALRTQRNMRLHLAAASVVLGASLFFHIGRVEFLAVCIAIAFVVVAELVNTAVEATVDVATQSFDPLAKVAKDVAAGAVFVAAVNALIVGYVVFFARLTGATDVLISRVREAPAHLTVIALVFTALAVLTAKAVTGTGTFLRGGWPSGHTALAAASATAIAHITASAEAAVLAGFVTALVAQSRVEGGAHTVSQVLLGAATGFLITTLVFQVFFF